MISFLICTSYFLCLFICIEYLTRKLKLDNETSRKIAHITAGVSAAFLPIFLSFHQIILLSALFLPVMYISKNKNIFGSIHSVNRNTLGEVYFPLGILITALFFPINNVFVYGILVMSLSDGFASIFGQKFGKRKYSFLRAHKSYVGSLAFFVTTLIITLAMFRNVSLLGAVMVSIVLTALEGCLSDGLDNLFLPPVAGALIFNLLRL